MTDRFQCIMILAQQQTFSKLVSVSDSSKDTGVESTSLLATGFFFLALSSDSFKAKQLNVVRMFHALEEEACLFLPCRLEQLPPQVWLEHVSCRGKFPKK